MPDTTRRTNIGPSIRHTTLEDGMKIATETTFVEDEQGIRRLVAKGSRIPAYLRLEHEGEDVDRREVAAPAVDEEASKAQHERQGYDEPEQGNTLEAVRNSAAVTAGGGKRQQRRQTQGGGSSSSES